MNNSHLNTKGGFSVSVVLPAYNEEKALPLTLDECARFLENLGADFEIIVVDDGSTDQTPFVLSRLKNSIPLLNILRHNTNKGYGEALRSGFSFARKEWILLMDSDGQFDISNLNDFLPFTERFDLVLGYRKKRVDSFFRDKMTKVYNLFINSCLHSDFVDVGCGFKLFKKNVWTAVQPIESYDHKIFTVEWLWKAHQKKFNIRFLPVRHRPRLGGKPTGARLSVIWQTVKALRHLKKLRSL